MWAIGLEKARNTKTHHTDKYFIGDFITYKEISHLSIVTKTKKVEHNIL